MCRHPHFWLFFSLLFAWFQSGAMAQPARLTVEIRGEDGQLIPCRCWVAIQGQRLFEPLGPAGCTPYDRDRSFSCDGEFEIEVPAGEGIVHIERGKEFLAVDLPFQVSAGETDRLQIPLKRWVDMPAAHWYSADMHVHFGVDDPKVLRQLAVADDVHITPVFTYWLRGTEPSWQVEWPANSEQAVSIDANHIVTRGNIEIERINRNAIPGGSVGASFLYNLRRPVFAAHFGEHFPADTSLCLAAQAHSPEVVIDTDKPSWAETVVGAALGTYDTVQVCHNHYHRNQTIAGGYGMIGPLAAGDSNAVTDDGLFHRTNALYYRFLNCGFRLAVSGGSAIGVMAVPMGYNRVYAQLDGPLSAERYWAAVKQGRSFATSGPMLTMTVDGQPLGAAINREPESEPLLVEVRLQAIETIDSVQLVHDGRIVQEQRIEHGEPQLDLKLSWQVDPKRSGWVAARALFRAPDGRLRQAHTSPIYITLEGKPTTSKEDAEYMIRWIDRLVEVAGRGERFPSSEEQQDLLAVYARARAVYEQIARTASQVWGD